MAAPPSPNLIELIAAHSTMPGRDRAENRLTAGLVAVLSKVPGLADELLDRCLPADGPGRAAIVRHEHPLGGGGGRIDLVLDTGRDPLARHAWIEAKLESPLSGSRQLEKYAARLALRGGASRRLILLAPEAARRKFPGVAPLADLAPGDEGPGFLAWEDVYALVDAWRRRRRRTTVDHWLTGQVLDYMEDKGLKPTGALTRAHIEVLEAQGRAESTMHAIVLEAAAAVEHGWKPPRKPRAVADKWNGDYAAGPPEASSGTTGSCERTAGSRRSVRWVAGTRSATRTTSSSTCSLTSSGTCAS